MITVQLQIPVRNFTAGTLSQFASARPFNATTGVDNNGDGANNDRPVINGVGHAEIGVSRHADVGRLDLCREPHPARQNVRR